MEHTCTHLQHSSTMTVVEHLNSALVGSGKPHQSPDLRILMKYHFSPHTMDKQDTHKVCIISNFESIRSPIETGLVWTKHWWITFPCHYNQSSGNFFTFTSPAYFLQEVSNSKGPLEWLLLSSQIQAVLAGGSCWSHSDRIIVWFETCQLSRLTVLGSWLTTQTTQ